MTIGDANRLVRALVGEDDFHDVEEVLPSYYDIAQREIATTVAPIFKTATVNCGEKIKLPEDLFRLISVSSGYERHDRTHITVIGEGTAVIGYYAFPQKITDEALLSSTFEVSAHVAPAIPYFAAAQTVLADSDMRRYYAFMDMYNDILSNAMGSKSEIRIVKLEATSEI